MKKLTSYQLKIIAIITMVIDHALKIFSNDIINYMQTNQIFTTTNYILFMIIMAIGRIAFPLFCYMIAEGCHYTHNIKKYISRLLLLGLISEIPFQYMMSILNNQPYQLHFSLQNVFFTLALGAISIESYRYLKEHYSSWISSLPVIMCAVIAQVLDTDYAAPGVLLIFFWFYCRNSKYWYLPGIVFSIFLYSGFMLTLGIINYGFAWFIILEAVLHTSFSCLSILFINQYNHQRGKSAKWIFYIFYPLHITTIVLLYFYIH